MTKTKFIKRKRPNIKKAVILFVLLVVVIILWKYLEVLMELIF